MLWHPPNIGNLLQHLADVCDDSKETATETPVHSREVLAAVFLINDPLKAFSFESVKTNRILPENLLHSFLG